MDHYHIETLDTGECFLCRTILEENISPNTYYSNLSFYEKDGNVILISDFKFIRNGYMKKVPKGYVVPINHYIGTIGSILLKNKVIRSLVVFSYNKDCLNYSYEECLYDLKRSLKSEGFGCISRYLITFIFNHW